jgi:hypothetical protein
MRGKLKVTLSGNAMDVKQAVAIAKKHIGELFADEQVSNLGLEEVEFDEAENCWNVTVGFSRPWDEPRNKLAELVQANVYSRRNFKVVRVADDTSEVVSVKNRESKAPV